MERIDRKGSLAKIQDRKNRGKFISIILVIIALIVMVCLEFDIDIDLSTNSDINKSSRKDKSHL
jgi:hypothetical protein